MNYVLFGNPNKQAPSSGSSGISWRRRVARRQEQSTGGAERSQPNGKFLRRYQFPNGGRCGTSLNGVAIQPPRIAQPGHAFAEITDSFSSCYAGNERGSRFGEEYPGDLAPPYQKAGGRKSRVKGAVGARLLRNSTEPPFRREGPSQGSHVTSRLTRAVTFRRLKNQYRRPAWLTDGKKQTLAP